MKFVKEIYGPKSMKSNDSGDSLTFHLALLAGQKCNLSNMLVCNQMLGKLMAVLAAAAHVKYATRLN